MHPIMSDSGSLFPITDSLFEVIPLAPSSYLLSTRPCLGLNSGPLQCGAELFAGACVARGFGRGGISEEEKECRNENQKFGCQ